jgi:hypothetical protein
VNAHALNPILNVSDFNASVAWFELLGWRKAWDWGEPPTLGAVGSGECEIFLCLDGQGGRGGANGMWMSIWVDDVDALHTWPPPSNVSPSATGYATANARSGRHCGRRSSATKPAIQTAAKVGAIKRSWNGSSCARTSPALLSDSAPAMVNCGKSWVAW